MKAHILLIVVVFFAHLSFAHAQNPESSQISAVIEQMKSSVSQAGLDPSHLAILVCARVKITAYVVQYNLGECVDSHGQFYYLLGGNWGPGGGPFFNAKSKGIGGAVGIHVVALYSPGLDPRNLDSKYEFELGSVPGEIGFARGWVGGSVAGLYSFPTDTRPNGVYMTILGYQAGNLVEVGLVPLYILGKQSGSVSKYSRFLMSLF